jgi:hypothetical protein
MFVTRIANHAARGMAVGALILSLGVTTFGASANAAPLVGEMQDCSSAAHARNEAVHVLHTAWKEFAGDLKQLARDARKLSHESEKASAVASKDARGVIASAKAELKEIMSQAHSDIQAAVDLGAACSDEKDSTTKTTTTTTTSTTTTATTTTPATAPVAASDSARTFDTSGLDAKYKGIVDQAIKDMQKVVDDARKALLDMTTVAESKEATEKDEEKVEQEVKKAKADRATAKQEREDKKADKAKDKVKATTKSHHSDKGEHKDHLRKADRDEDRD